jgi:type IX secretion system PorP/SprF family membrane protein
MNMRVITKISLAILLIGVGIAKVSAQVDPHFSQYYMYPSYLNPALTGAFDGDYRATAIYRSQWGNVTTPFSTPGISLDINGDKSLNYGICFLQQTAGDGGYNYTTAYGNVAYTGIRFGKAGNQRLVFGLQGGLIQRKFNPSKLRWGTQWNPSSGYDASLPGDILSKTSAASFDAAAGLLFYDGQPGKKANFYGGFSASHLTMPEDKFSVTGSEKLPMRFSLHGGVKLAVSESLIITPNVLYMRQGTASETMIGAYAQIKTPAVGTDFLVGLNYRVKDAFSPYIGFNSKNFTLGMSYDITTSDLSKIQKGSNSFEISLSFIGRKKTQTPEVEFICPRL